MRLPCEIIVNDLLPFLRKVIAERLHSKGYTQTQIAHMLNVSQPAVSYYLKLEIPQSRYNLNSIKDRGLKLADKLMSGESVSTIINDICSLCMSHRTFGITCRFHREQLELEEDCTACIVNIPTPMISEREEALQDLRAAIEMIEDTPEFVQIMPEVRVQIVRSISNTRSTEEIAAVPGRIVKVKGKPKGVANPEFGASSHTAEILLAFVRKNPTLGTRAAICIKYDSTIQRAIEELGLTYERLKITNFSSEEGGNNKGIVHAIETQLQKEKTPEIVIDPGGEGREPIAYLFGKTATEVSHQSIKIAQKVLLA
ncbi:MAG: thiamine-phosphate synthase family protein [Candidatus Heimdallarchaeota archaeon]